MSRRPVVPLVTVVHCRDSDQTNCEITSVSIKNDVPFDLLTITPHTAAKACEPRIPSSTASQTFIFQRSTPRPTM